MIFNFLTYIRPIWYFNLRPEKDYGYFPTIQAVKDAGFSIKEDEAYLSTESRQRDIGWRAFQSGFVSKNSTSLDIWNKVPIPLIDEYRFIRKNFSPVWTYYVLLIRVLTFHNPISEWRAFFKTAHVKREMHTNDMSLRVDFNRFESTLIKKNNPLVSVIIPTLNRYPYLRDVLRDLEKQSYTNIEVIVVDQTDSFDETVYSGWNLELKYWFQSEKALWKARNDAIKTSKGDLVLLYDDDSRVEPDWIEQHLKALDFFDVDISSGVSISEIGDTVPAHYSYFRWGDQLDTGNVLIKKKVFKKIGLFDRQFEKQRMGDGEFGLRAYLAGFSNISNPYAKRIHLKVSEGGLRQMGSWDGWRPKNILSPRPVPSVLYLSRKYFGNRLSLYAIMIGLLPSIVPYKLKRSKILKLISFLLLPLILPFIGYQAGRSWVLASKKLKQGDLIEEIDDLVITDMPIKKK